VHPKDNITLGEGSGNTFIVFPKERRKGDCVMLKTPEKIRELQRKLYQTLGLYRIPITAPWTHSVKAAGRR